MFTKILYVSSQTYYFEDTLVVLWTKKSFCARKWLFKVRFKRAAHTRVWFSLALKKFRFSGNRPKLAFGPQKKLPDAFWPIFLCWTLVGTPLSEKNVIFFWSGGSGHVGWVCRLPPQSEKISSANQLGVILHWPVMFLCEKKFGNNLREILHKYNISFSK